MTVWVALLRGVNVGGNNILSMKKLRELLECAGFSSVRTYIQSGNCVFASRLQDRDALSAAVADAIEAEFGFRPAVIVLTPDEFADALAANPFPVDEPKHVHFQFLGGPPEKTDFDGLRAVAQPGEDFRLIGDVLYLYLPHGSGRSPVAQKLGRFVKAEMTARNLATVRTIADMARDAA